MKHNRKKNTLNATSKKGVGDRLRDVLGSVPKKKYSTKRLQTIVALIDDIIAIINEFRVKNKISKRLNDNNVIDFLFPSAEGKDEKKRLQTTTQCIIDFLDWCKGVISNNGFVPFNLLDELIYDVSWIGFLGGAFSCNRCGRAHEWIPVDAFAQTFRWFCSGIAPERLPSEFMCIFELRQTMEVKFKTLIGMKHITGAVRIAHDIIPNVLKRNLTAANFSPQSGTTLTQVMHIYEWSDISIHNMSTDFVWLVWKAMMVCSSFFSPTNRNNGMKSIHDSFEMSDVLLYSIRVQFVDCVCRRNAKVKEFTIEWGAPEAAIVDANGKCMDVPKKKELVINPYFK